MLESVLNAIFSPVLKLQPIWGMLIISSIITVIVTLINDKLMKSAHAKDFKQKMDKTKAEMMESQKSGDKEKVNKYMEKMMEMNSEYLQKMMKPLSVSLAISMLLVILFFPWMKANYNGNIILTIPKVVPLIGGKDLNWLWWYIITSLIVGLVLRKITDTLDNIKKNKGDVNG